MPYLYRCYSDDSHGVNGPDVIAPAAASKRTTATSYRAPRWVPDSSMKNKLKSALLWKDLEDNPFSFLTSSLLLAEQMGLYRKAAVEKNIKIVAIDTEAARTPDGKPITFRLVPAMMKECGLVVLNKDGSAKQYDEVFVAMDAIVLGPGCKIASLDALIETGLYHLYPPLAHTENNSERAERLGRHNKPRIHFALMDMRKYSFEFEHALTPDQITLAAKLASRFISPSELGGDKVPIGILAALLGFQKRQKDDSVLSAWLRQYCQAYVETSDDDLSQLTLPYDKTKLPEVEQAHALDEILMGWQVRQDVLTVPSYGPKAAYEREERTWRSWWLRNKREYRKSSSGDVVDVEMSVGLGKRRRGSEGQEVDVGDGKYRSENRRRKSLVEEIDAGYPRYGSKQRFDGSFEARLESGKRYRRDGRPWVPRAEYEAQRATTRGYRRHGSDKWHQRR